MITGCTLCYQFVREKCSSGFNLTFLQCPLFHLVSHRILLGPGVGGTLMGSRIPRLTTFFNLWCHPDLLCFKAGMESGAVSRQVRGLLFRSWQLLKPEQDFILISLTGRNLELQHMNLGAHKHLVCVTHKGSGKGCDEWEAEGTSLLMDHWEPWGSRSSVRLVQWHESNHEDQPFSSPNVLSYHLGSCKSADSDLSNSGKIWKFCISKFPGDSDTEART